MDKKGYTNYDSTSLQIDFGLKTFEFKSDNCAHFLNHQSI